MVVWSTKISFFEWFQMYLWFYSTESTRRRNRTAMTRMKILYTDRYMIRAYIINQLKNHCIFIFTIQFVYWHHQWYLLTTLLQLFLWSSWQVYNEIFLFFNISFQRLTFCPSWFICNFVPGFFFISIINCTWDEIRTHMLFERNILSVLGLPFPHSGNCSFWNCSLFFPSTQCPGSGFLCGENQMFKVLQTIINKNPNWTLPPYYSLRIYINVVPSNRHLVTFKGIKTPELHHWLSSTYWQPVCQSLLHWDYFAEGARFELAEPLQVRKFSRLLE